jgi:hypothetical protein
MTGDKKKNISRFRVHPQSATPKSPEGMTEYYTDQTRPARPKSSKILNPVVFTVGLNTTSVFSSRLAPNWN